MTERGSRRGAANLAPILMILSFLTMAGLLWWLNMTAEQTEQVVMEEEDTTVDLGASAMVVTASELDVGAANLVGQLIRLEDVGLSATVGDHAFMVELGTAEQSSPFLIVPDSALIAGGPTMAPERVTVTGRLRERTDSVLEVWTSSGVIPEGQAPLAEFATHFIEAGQIRAPDPGEGGDGDSGGDGEGGEGGEDAGDGGG